MHRHARSLLRFVTRTLVFCLGWRITTGICLAQLAGEAPPPLQVDAITRVVEQVEPSVVSILRIRQQPVDGVAERVGELPFHREDDREILPNDFGTGILVQAPGNDELYVLTAYHVIRGGMMAGRPLAQEQTSLQLRFHHHRTCRGTVFAADPRSDLAVLAFDLKELGGERADLHPLDWQTSAHVRKGEFIVTLGNPYALARDGSASVSWGIVSNLARRPMLSFRTEINEQSLFQLGTVMQLDTRLQLGGSGGPVVNLQGQLVGIGTALAAFEGYEKSAGFAIPVAPPMRRVIEALLAGQEVEYGLLGVTPVTVGAAEMRRHGLYDRQPSAVEVHGLPEGSPAMLAGIQLRDILLKINDQPLLASADLMRIVGEEPPEAEVKVDLYRPDRGQVLTRRSRLGKWPVRDDEGIIATRPKYPAWRGVRVDYPTARQKFVDQRFLPGVLVVDVAEASRAQQAQLQAGQVITHVQGQPVRTPAEFQRAVKDLSGEVALRLHHPLSQLVLLVKP